MKLLLIGFSDKNSSIFEIFCTRNFENISCLSVGRQFGDQLRLVLPKLTITQSDADAYVIDLDGVGMTHYSDKSKAALRNFIDKKPVVLVKKRDNKEWLPFVNSINEEVVYMTSPYSTKEALTILTELESRIKRCSQKQDVHQPLDTTPKATSVSNDKTTTAKTVTNANSTQMPKTSNKMSDHLTPDSVKVYNAVNKKPQAIIINDILKAYFHKTYDSMLARTILSIFTYSEPIKVIVGNYHILVNPFEKSVLVNGDILRVIDYLSILGKRKHSPKTQSIDMTILTARKYDKLSQLMISDGAKKHSYITVLWQISEEVIPLNEPVGHYPFAIKVKYVPNFSVMRFVPSYVPSVVSTCLNRPRTIEELQNLFPDLSLQQLNRTVLICILSSIVDPDILANNVQQQPARLSTQSSTQLQNDRRSNNISSKSTNNDNAMSENKDISTAKRTGFFRRLLQKLAS